MRSLRCQRLVSPLAFNAAAFLSCCVCFGEIMRDSHCSDRAEMCVDEDDDFEWTSLLQVKAIVSGPTEKQISPGVFMPYVSLGHPDDGSSMSELLQMWLSEGGVGIDTALVYHNHGEIAQALEAAGTARSSVFITTKVPCMPGTSAGALQHIRQCLHELKTDHVDLLLMHWACEMPSDTQGTWLGMQEALVLGLTRAIGVSNFRSADLDAVLALGGTQPAVNQCQFSVGSHNDEHLAYNAARNVSYESYSPLMNFQLLAENGQIKAIAAQHNKSVAQVCLRWILQQGVSLATSPGLNRRHHQEDLSLFHWNLSQSDMSRLSSILIPGWRPKPM